MDDHSSSLQSATPIAVLDGSNGLDEGIESGIIGYEDIYDEDWFSFPVKKGATYRFTLTGGDELGELNRGMIQLGCKSISSTHNEYDQACIDQLGNENSRKAFYAASSLNENHDLYYYSEEISEFDGIITTEEMNFSGILGIGILMPNMSGKSGTSFDSTDPRVSPLHAGSYVVTVEQLTRGFSDPLPSVDLDGDGFVDEVTNYQMWTETTGVDLVNRRGRTYSDNTSRKWDAIKAVENDSGFSVLVEGHLSKEGKYKVVTANEEGVIGGTTRWLNGNQMLDSGYEEIFSMDFNGNGVVDLV